jgi:3-oxoacyl-[acyl-carrier-protein] synthase-3
MIRTGVVRNAVVIGVEVISPFMDWGNRNVAVLFGDGAAAVVLQASEEKTGVLAEKLGCYADARHILRVRGMGAAYANRGINVGVTAWDFDGQEIFKRAVHGMTEASNTALGRAGLAIGDIDLVVPHQANLRIIEFVGKRIGAAHDRVFLTVERYGNMSAATVPVALVDAIEEGRVKPGARILTPAFGGGLTYCAHVIQWGERTTPKQASPVELPPCEKSALEMVRAIMAAKGDTSGAAQGLAAPLVA